MAHRRHDLPGRDRRHERGSSSEGAARARRGEFERVGGHETIKVDARIIAATHRDLEEEVQKGNFREDLFYRLYVIPIMLPSLRERKADIPFLVYHFLDEFAQKTRKPS